MENEKQISDLKVGDEVVIHSSHNNEYIDKITKITATQICINSLKFRKDDGKQLGLSKWSVGYLIIPTEEIRQKIKHDNHIRNLKSMMEAIYSKTKKFTKDEIELLYPIISNIYRRLK